MYLALHDRIYNLGSWSMLSLTVEPGSYAASQGAVNRGSARITLPGISLDIVFTDTTAEHPVSLEVLTELLHAGKDADLGIIDYSEFEAMYREQEARTARRKALRKELGGE